MSARSRPAVALIRKLIAVLESIERLPLHLYDTPGSSYNLQVGGVPLADLTRESSLPR